MDEHREIEYARTLQEAAVLLGLAAEEIADRNGSPALVGEMAAMMRRVERVLSTPRVAARADHT